MSQKSNLDALENGIKMVRISEWLLPLMVRTKISCGVSPWNGSLLVVKAGVGKTIKSYSLAVSLALTRVSVFLLTTDPAHNLSEAIEQKC